MPDRSQPAIGAAAHRLAPSRACGRAAFPGQTWAAGTEEKYVINTLSLMLPNTIWDNGSDVRRTQKDVII